MSAPWPDQPEVSVDTAVAALEAGAQLRGEYAGPSVRLEPHHAAGRRRTDEEQAVLEARTVACATQANLHGAAARVRETWTRTDHLLADAIHQISEAYK